MKGANEMYTFLVYINILDCTKMQKIKGQFHLELIIIIIII